MLATKVLDQMLEYKPQAATTACLGVADQRSFTQQALAKPFFHNS